MRRGSDDGPGRIAPWLLTGVGRGWASGLVLGLALVPPACSKDVSVDARNGAGDGGSAGAAADPWAEACGCDANQSCDYPAEGGQSVCFPYVGTKAGELCGAGDCEHGVSCVNGVCHDRCQDAEDCGMTSCFQVKVNGAPVTGWYVCSDQCDPRDTAGCGAGRGCYMVADDASACMAAGVSPTGCDWDWDCQPGYGCQTWQHVCQKRCRSAPECEAGENCGSRWEDGTRHTEHIGEDLEGLCQ